MIAVALLILLGALVPGCHYEFLAGDPTVDGGADGGLDGDTADASDLDGTVDVVDLLAILACWGPGPE